MTFSVEPALDGPAVDDELHPIQVKAEIATNSARHV
jgi:hypothetical protein